MRRRPAPKQTMTAHFNHVAAFAKVSTAPLASLTPAMIESIAASHARRGTAGFEKLHRELAAVVDNRKAMVR